MKIAYFANPNSPHDCKWINHFAKNNSVILITSKANTEQGFLDNGIPTHPILPNTFPFKNVVKRKATISTINKVLTTNKTEIVHSMYAIPNAIWANLSCCKNHIATTRGSDMLIEFQQYSQPTTSIKQNFTNRYLKKQVEKALQNARYITSTSMPQQAVIKNITEQSKLRLIRTGVDVERFEENLQNAPIISSNYTIFHPRGVKDIYNVPLLLNSFKLVINKISTAKLVLATFPGTKDEVEKVKQVISNFELEEHVTLLPKLSNTEMISHYKNASVVVMIPKSDGVPVTAIEAMLAKKPLIMGALPYDDDLFNETTVWKAEGFSASAIAQLLLRGLNVDGKKTKNAYIVAKEKASLQSSLAEVGELYNKMKEANE